MKEVNENMKYGSRYLYSSPEEIEKLTVVPEAWIKEQEEKARLKQLAADKEAKEEANSRPSSKQKKKKPKKGKKGKKDENEEEEEQEYPIVNLDYACFRTNSLPTLSAFHEFYKMLREKVYSNLSLQLIPLIVM